MNKYKGFLFLLLFLTPWSIFAADPSITVLTETLSKTGGTQYSLSLKILAAMTLLSILPALLMTTTAFTRIMIVLSILRQALGMPSVPTNQILLGLSLFLTFFIMTPVFNQVNQQAITPLMAGKITEQQALENSIAPFRKFMLNQTRQADLKLFLELSGKPTVSQEADISLPVLMAAFVTSELKTAFQIGFILFLPFLIIDLVVSSILMSMGMMMLSPMVISLPFKVLLFVLVDGWVLIAGTLAHSFAA